MGIQKPFRRTIRPTPSGSYSEADGYCSHPKFAKNQLLFRQPFSLIEKDFKEIFDFIDPSDSNLYAHSSRLMELILRSCIEIEANFRAILEENGYEKIPRKCNIKDYQKIEKSHRLSEYCVSMKKWRGAPKQIQPFAHFGEDEVPNWYYSYNRLKHDRINSAEHANLDNCMSAVAGLHVLLCSQFVHSGDETAILVESVDRYKQHVLGSIFETERRPTFARDECYIFSWNAIKDEEDPFDEFRY